MIRQIVVGLSQFVSILAFIGGILLVVLAGATTFMYDLSRVSAIQMTQIYSQGIYMALLGIGSLIVALSIQVMLYTLNPTRTDRLIALNNEITDIRLVLRHVDTLIQFQSQGQNARPPQVAENLNYPAPPPRIE